MKAICMVLALCVVLTITTAQDCFVPSMKNFSNYLQCNETRCTCEGTVHINKSIIQNKTCFKYEGNSTTIRGTGNCTFHFENIPHVTITNTTLEDAALSFFNCSNVTLEDTHIINSTGVVNITFEGAALSFFNCSNVTLEDTHIINSTGVGLVMVNTWHGKLENCNITNCNRAQDKSKMKSTSGGGVHIRYNDSSYATGGEVKFINTHFENNVAREGGGLYIESQNETRHTSVTVEFNSCTWTENSAGVGSALYFINNGSIDVMGSFEGKTCIHSNGGIYIETEAFLLPIGTLYTDSININFQGTTYFDSNNHTALVASNAAVSFASDNMTEFNNNRGHNGGAIALLNGAFIKADSNLTFSNNKADSKGGAIYAGSVSPHGLLQCFIVSTDRENLKFTNNTARGKANSIFATLASVHACKPEVHLCCDNETETEPTNITTKAISNAYPGMWTEATVSDFCGNNLANRTVLSVEIKNSTTLETIAGPLYVTNNKIQLLGAPNSNVTLEVYSQESTVTISNLTKIPMQDCPFAFTFNNETLLCEESYFQELLSCSESNFSCSLTRHGQWVGQYQNVTVTGYCSYLDRPDLPDSLPRENAKEVGEHLCSSVNRTGTLCGDCANGSAPAFNSKTLVCVECDNDYSGWWWLILLKLLPATALFTVLVIFNISLTSGPLNAFVLFSQVVTSAFFLYSGSTVLDSTYTTLYEIWNLRFLTSFSSLQHCLYREAEPLQVIALEYVIILYPLLLIPLLYCVHRPLNYCLSRCRIKHRTFNLASILAVYLVLSYVKLVETSIHLILTSTLYDQSGKRVSTVVLMQGTVNAYEGKHIVYLIVASLVLAGIGLLLPVLLLALPNKHLRSLLRILSCGCCRKVTSSPGKLEQVLGEFYRPYKNGARSDKKDTQYFAGLYFLFRLILAFLEFNQSWALRYLQQHVLCILATVLVALFRPYRKQILNWIDTIFFLFLTLISLFSNYNSNLKSSNQEPSNLVLGLQYTLVILPLLYLPGYILYRLLSRRISNCWKQHVSSTSSVWFVPNTQHEGADRRMSVNTVDSNHSNMDDNAGLELSTDSAFTDNRGLPIRWETDHQATEVTHLLNARKEGSDCNSTNSFPLSVLSNDDIEL